MAELILSMDNRVRAIICIALFLISVLLIGAAKVTGELSGRKNSREFERDQWTNLMFGISSEIPIESRHEWRRLIAQDPQFSLRVNTIHFVTVAQSE